MKLLVDGATGSNELVAPLQKMGLPAVKAHLEYGDLAFVGRGEGGTPLFIGIELKKIGDLIQSMCTTKRLQGHQLLGLVQDFDRRYLLIEGDFHHDDKGNTVAFRGAGRPKPLAGAPGAIAFEQEILNIQTRGGCWVRHTTNRRDTLRFIAACYRYWTDKDLDEHKSHLALYAADMDKALLSPPSDFRIALKVLLPNIGYVLSGVVEEYVGGVDAPLKDKMRRVLAMKEDEWAALETQSRKGVRKRLGASKAQQIMEAWK